TRGGRLACTAHERRDNRIASCMLERHCSCQSVRREHEAVSLPKWTLGDIVTSMSPFARNTTRTVVVAMLLSGAAAAPAHAQDATREVATPDSLASWYRDPHTAQILGSFIPGAGHFYAGEKLRGLGLSAAAVIGIASGIVFLEKRECHLVTFGVESCDPEELTLNRINGITQLGTGVAAW